MAFVLSKKGEQAFVLGWNVEQSGHCLIAPACVRQAVADQGAKIVSCQVSSHERFVYDLPECLPITDHPFK